MKIFFDLGPSQTFRAGQISLIGRRGWTCLESILDNLYYVENAFGVCHGSLIGGAIGAV